MRTDCITSRPDLTWEVTSKKTILLIDIACPNENNKMANRDEKIGKYNRLCSELRKRREGYRAKVIPTIIGCLGGGMKELKESIRQIFDYDKELEWISREKTDKKSVVWTVNMRCFNLTNKFWQLKSPPIPFFAKFEVN